MPYSSICCLLLKPSCFSTSISTGNRDVAALGYGRIVLVAADCPAIDAAAVKAALAGLDRGAAVLGPASDGGVNLIGLPAECLGRVDLEPLPWESPVLFSALRETLAAAGLEVVTLALSGDIDSADD